MAIKGLDNITAKLDGIDEKQRYYIFIGLLVLVFLLDYFILMRPQIETLTKINPEIKVLKDDLKKANEDIGKLAFYQAQVKQFQGEFDAFSTRVISRYEVPIVLEKISLIADRSGMQIDQIMPQSDELEVLMEDSAKEYSSIPILIEARTGYHAFGRFINKVENDNVHLQVADFSVTSVENSRRHRVVLTLLAVVYEDLD